MHMYVQVYSTVLEYVEVRDYHNVSSSIAFLLIYLFVRSFIHLFIYWGHLCQGMSMGVREQLPKVCSLLPCGSQGANSGHQT